MKKKMPILLACLYLLSGCDLIDYHPYDVRISGKVDINAQNTQRIEERCKGKTTLRFIAMGDSQRWYDETEEFVHAANAQGDIDFVIHGGDVSDFGVTDEFLWQRDILEGLQMPYVVLLGNHDCIGTGRETYKKVFGDPNFSFIAGDVKFVCLNTNALEYDYSEPVPDLGFMEAQVTDRQDEYSKTVVSMHARPYSDVFNNNIAKAFQYNVKQFPGLQFCTVAHGHHFNANDLFGDGVMYYESDCMKHRNYLLFTITPDNYTYEVVYF